MADDEIEVNPSAIATHAPVLLRQLLLVLGGAGTIIALLGSRDMAGLWVYLHSSDFATILTTAISLGVLVYGQWKARHDKRKWVQAATDPANSKVRVGPATPPPAEP